MSDESDFKGTAIMHMTSGHVKAYPYLHRLQDVNPRHACRLRRV